MFRGNWGTVVVPPELAHWGMKRLEQGGILLGWLTGPDSALVVTFTTPGPLDIQLPGLIALQDPKHEVELNESGLRYLGFWHSHPVGTPSDYSPEDLTDWRNSGAEMFAQMPPDQSLIFYPIVTGDRLRVWVMNRDLNLTELEEVRSSTHSTPRSLN